MVSTTRRSPLSETPSGINIVRIRGGDKDAGLESGLLCVFLTFLRASGAIAPDHVGGMRAQPQSLQQRAIAGLVMIEGTIGPTGNVKRFAVGVKQNPIRAAAGFETVDHDSGLRVYHHDRVVIQIAGVKQMPIGIDGDVADEVARGPRRAFNDFEGPGGGELAVLIE